MNLPPKMEARLTQAAARVRMNKSKLVNQAVEAAIASIERHGSLVLPIAFVVTYLPQSKDGPSLRVVRNN